MNAPRPFSTASAIANMAEMLDRDELREIPLELVDADPDQPRKTWDTPEAIAEFEATRESIRSEGVRNPVTVRNAQHGRFILISGETRFRACKELALATIPALVRQRIEMRQVRIDQLIENVRRNALNSVDLASALQERLDEGMSREELQHALGMTKQWLSKRLSVLKMPADVQEVARAGYIRDVDTLSALAKLDERERSELIVSMQSGTFDGSAVRKGVRRQRKQKARLTVDPNIKGLQSRMQDHFGAKVRIDHNPGSNKGSVTFSYFSLDELQGFLEKWNLPSE